MITAGARLVGATFAVVGVACSAVLASAQVAQPFAGGSGVFHFSEVETLNDGTVVTLTHRYAFDIPNNRAMYQFEDEHGTIETELTVGGKTYIFESANPSDVAAFDPCNEWPADRGECPFSQADIDHAKLQAWLNLVPEECEVLPTPDTLPPRNPTLLSTVKGVHQFLLGTDPSGEQSFYTQSATTGKPLTFGEFDVTAFYAGLPDIPYLFEIPHACLPDVDEEEDDLDTISSGVETEDLSFLEPNPDANTCNAPIQHLTWRPLANELNDFAWTNDGGRWDNNPSLSVNPSNPLNTAMFAVGFVLFPVAPAVGWVLQALAAGAIPVPSVPTARIWGTIWCGKGNEFTSYARRKYVSNSAGKRVKKGLACGGETPLNEHTGAAISINDVYMAGSITKRKPAGGGNRRTNLELFNYLLPFAPEQLVTYGVNGDIKDVTDWTTAELPSQNTWDSSGKIITKAQRLTRCRAVPNFIDPDYKAYVGGLESIGMNVQTNTYSGAPYESNSNNLYGIKLVREWDWAGNLNNKNIWDDWCRQHDWAPIAYNKGSKGTCIADGRAYYLLKSHPSQAWYDYGWLLFHPNMVFFPCKNVKLRCQRNWLGICKNWVLKWKNSYKRKYHSGPKEGLRFSGPIGRNDLGQQTVCATLRLPTEGADATTVVQEIGNGVCDCQYNNDYWGYDGGDCCEETCRHPVDGTKCSFLPEFQGYDCKQPGCMRDDVKNVGRNFNARQEPEEGRTNQYAIGGRGAAGRGAQGTL